ncbi:hypothetical protein MDAP_001291 [Mitosporidium daphniae]|uniref:Uncharacterized protein n=1 Tax=Mitosporidium daphniae TaxID=1485682 RepID=A0A098VUX2_9MICR|nr:uncharacterized protein DI09_33p180 [Mitosporidium daphniae]KGG51501.1 hypothetical protein DI09_33p180 [Mitosporidium daphniae]|eukprot:XP_013237928.1 uncharacterized protein DI09_33p180 [Mitosporidium daphniae]
MRKGSLAIILLTLYSCAFAKLDKSVYMDAEEYAFPEFKELPREEFKAQPEYFGCRLPKSELQTTLRQPSICGNVGCLPAPKKICPASPLLPPACVNKTTTTTNPPLLVCLLPSQPLPPKPSICTMTSIFTGPCSPNATKSNNTTPEKAITPTSTTTTADQKGIIPLVKALFLPKPTTTNITTSSTSSVIADEKKNSMAFKCPTSIYAEPASIPPAVYEILSRIAKERT